MIDHRKLEELRNQAINHAQTAFVRTERRRRLQHALKSLYSLLLEVSLGSPALSSPALRSSALRSSVLSDAVLRNEAS